jgi:hypothetical protein
LDFRLGGIRSPAAILPKCHSAVKYAKLRSDFQGFDSDRQVF